MGGGGSPAGASVKHCYFRSSFFCKRLSPSAPVEPHSRKAVTELRNMAFGVDPGERVNCRHAVMTADTRDWTKRERHHCRPIAFRAGITYDQYAPMLYTVPAGAPRVPVSLDAANSSLRAALGAGVPIPSYAQPALGSDGQLIVYQPSTNTMWELWRAHKDLTGTWHASWGGVIRDVSRNPGHYEDVRRALAPGGYLEQHLWGGPASSIPNLPGLITVAQLRSGVIGHALVFSTWANSPSKWVYPAQRTDGRCRHLGHYCSDIPQGARFRLDPSFDVKRIHDRVARMLAKAAQDYGMVLNNTSGSGVTFYAEGWRGHPGWSDPYYGDHGLFTRDGHGVSSSVFMRDFPWNHLEMIRHGGTCSDPSRECPQPARWPFAR